MADTVPGGSVTQTGAVALPLTAGLIFLQWLVHPSWPPPQEVLTIALGVSAPVVHLLGKAVMARLNRVADRIDDGVINDSNVVTVAPPVIVTPAAGVTAMAAPAAPIPAHEGATS